jgi:hypothetical protein
MNWLGLLITVVMVGGGILAGIIFCSATGHAPRLRSRNSLSEREESEIAIVASQFAALPADEHAFALATLMRWSARLARTFGNIVCALLAEAVDSHEAPTASSESLGRTSARTPELRQLLSPRKGNPPPDGRESAVGAQQSVFDGRALGHAVLGHGSADQLVDLWRNSYV